MHYAKPVAVVLATSAIAFGITAVLHAAEPAANAPSFTAPSARDRALVERVRAALLADPALSEARIDVYAASGVVSLSGEVRDDASVSRALSLVGSVEGVIRVENGLEVGAQQ